MAGRSVSSVLYPGVGGLAVLLRREGMDQAGLEVGLAEGVLHGPVVFAGAFDGDDEIGQVVLLHRLADAADARLEVAAVVRQGGRLQEHTAVEVGEEVAGAHFGTVRRRCRSARARRPGREA